MMIEGDSSLDIINTMSLYLLIFLVLGMIIIYFDIFGLTAYLNDIETCQNLIDAGSGIELWNRYNCYNIPNYFLNGEIKE